MNNDLDVIVIGGGVAGLWFAAECVSAGYRVCLIERDSLGGGQTLAAQGIIHGGTKYALQGVLSESAQAIAGMPSRWRECLNGMQGLDLRGVTVRSAHQYLWSAGSLGGRVAGFFASKVMADRMTALSGDDIPEPLRESGGMVYRLDEPVVDVRDLVRRLGAIVGRSRLIHGQVRSLDMQEGRVILPGTGRTVHRLSAPTIVVTAGAGIAELCSTPVQRRALHMVMAKGSALPPLFAHALSANNLPRVTITSHRHQDGETVWYLGGALAEAGATRSPQEQIAHARKEMAELFPAIPWAGVRFASWRGERVEPPGGGVRPDTPRVGGRGRVLWAWPVKLAFAPLLADQLKARLLRPQAGKEVNVDLPMPPVGMLPWDAVTEWS